MKKRTFLTGLVGLALLLGACGTISENDQAAADQTAVSSSQVPAQDGRLAPLPQVSQRAGLPLRSMQAPRQYNIAW